MLSSTQKLLQFIDNNSKSIKWVVLLTIIYNSINKKLLVVNITFASVNYVNI